MTTATTLKELNCDGDTLRPKCVVLLSGGIDSTVLLYDLSREYECYPVSILYGQRHLKELWAAQHVCGMHSAEMRLRWRKIDLGCLSSVLLSTLTGHGSIPHNAYDKETMSKTVVPNRNMILLSVAAGYALSIGAQAVAYAAHAGDHYIYPDCRPEFVASVGLTIRLGTDNKVHLIEPYVNFQKSLIVARGHVLNVPLGATWSCYEGGTIHCGVCGTCIERRKAFKEANVFDPTTYAGVQL